MGWCGGPERIESTDLMLPGNECLNDTWTYINEYHNTRYGGLERTDYLQFLLQEGVVVLKELRFNSFNFGRGDSLKITDF